MSDDWLGEIVEASTTRFRAVARETFAPPAFGSFVKSADGTRETFGVVSHVEHASIDPSRRAIPLGRAWDDLDREQPQVRDLLTTEFEATCIAFSDGAIRPFLPPVPPRVHDFVVTCSSAEMLDLTADLSFVRTLGSTGLPTAGELVAAAVRCAAPHHPDERAFLVAAGREVADLFRQDHEQAMAVLRRFGLGQPASRPSSQRRVRS